MTNSEKRQTIIDILFGHEDHLSGDGYSYWIPHYPQMENETDDARVKAFLGIIADEILEAIHATEETAELQ